MRFFNDNSFEIRMRLLVNFLLKEILLKNIIQSEVWGLLCISNKTVFMFRIVILDYSADIISFQKKRDKDTAFPRIVFGSKRRESRLRFAKLLFGVWISRDKVSRKHRTTTR